jgi:hypothetical protein
VPTNAFYELLIPIKILYNFLKIKVPAASKLMPLAGTLIMRKMYEL